MQLECIKWSNPSTTLLVGPSNSGKTSLITKILQNRYNLIGGGEIKTILFYNRWQPIYDIWVKLGLIHYSFNGVPHIDEFKSLCEFYSLDAGVIVIFDDLGSQILKNLDLFEEIFVVLSHHMKISVFLVLHNLYEKGLRKISLNSNRIILTNNPRDKYQISFLARQTFPGTGNFLPSVYKYVCEYYTYPYLILDFSQNINQFLRVTTNWFENNSHIMSFCENNIKCDNPEKKSFLCYHIIPSTIYRLLTNAENPIQNTNISNNNIIQPQPVQYSDDKQSGFDSRSHLSENENNKKMGKKIKNSQLDSSNIKTSLESIPTIKDIPKLDSTLQSNPPIEYIHPKNSISNKVEETPFIHTPREIDKAKNVRVKSEINRNKNVRKKKRVVKSINPIKYEGSDGKVKNTPLDKQDIEYKPIINDADDRKNIKYESNDIKNFTNHKHRDDTSDIKKDVSLNRPQHPYIKKDELQNDIKKNNTSKPSEKTVKKTKKKLGIKNVKLKNKVVVPKFGEIFKKHNISNIVRNTQKSFKSDKTSLTNEDKKSIGDSLVSKEINGDIEMNPEDSLKSKFGKKSSKRALKMNINREIPFKKTKLNRGEKRLYKEYNEHDRIKKKMKTYNLARSNDIYERWHM